MHNVEGLLLEVAFAEENAGEARRAYQVIRQDAWEATTRGDRSERWLEGRVLMLEKR